MKIAALVLAVAAPVALVACGGSSSSSGTPAGGTPIKTITIDETEFKLSPSAVKIAKPGTYVITGVNNGSIAHAIAIEGNGLGQKGSTVSPGGTSTVTVTVTKAGSYTLYCPVDGHRAKGMEGTLALGGTSGGGTTGGTSTSGGSRY